MPIEFSSEDLARITAPELSADVDLENPETVEGVATGQVAPISNKINFLSETLGTSFAHTDKLMRSSDVMFRLLSPEDESAALAELESPELEERRAKTEEYKDDLYFWDPTIWLGDAAEFVPSAVESVKQGGILAAGLAVGGAVVGGAVTKTPAGAAAGARIGARIGFPTGAFKASALMAIGDVYPKLRKNGISQSTARAASITAGGLIGAIEFLQLRGMGNVAAKAFIKTEVGKQSIQKFIQVYVASLPKEVTEQVLQENTQLAVDLLTQEITSLIEDNPEAMPTPDEINAQFIDTTISTIRGATVLAVGSKLGGATARGAVNVSKKAAKFTETVMQRAIRENKVDTALADRGLEALTESEFTLPELWEAVKIPLTLTRKKFREFQEEKAGITEEDIARISETPVSEILDQFGPEVFDFTEEVTGDGKKKAAKQLTGQAVVLKAGVTFTESPTERAALQVEELEADLAKDPALSEEDKIGERLNLRSAQIVTELDEQAQAFDETFKAEKPTGLVGAKIRSLQEEQERVQLERTLREDKEITPEELEASLDELHIDQLMQGIQRAKEKGGDKAAGKKVRSELTKAIRESGLKKTDQEAFLTAVKETDSIFKLLTQIDKVKQKAAEKKEEYAFKREAARVQRLFKRARPAVAGKRPKGKFTPGVQRFIENVERNMKPKKEEAASTPERFKELHEITNERALTSQELAEFKAAQLTLFNDAKTAEGLKAIADTIQRAIVEGRDARSEHAEQEAAQLEADLETVLSEVQGAKPIDLDQETQEFKLFPKLKMFMSQWAGQDTFGGLWDLATLDTPGRGKTQQIMDTFRTKIAEKKELRKVREKYVDILTEAAGIETWTDFLKYVRAASKVENHGKYTNSKGRQVKLVASRMTLVSRYMQLQDPSIAAALEKGNGFTRRGQVEEGASYEEVLDEVLTDQDKKVADGYLQSYKWIYDNVANPLWQAWYGIDLPFREFYSPISREGAEVDTVNLFASQEMGFRASVAPQSAKKRVASDLRIGGQNAQITLDRYALEWVHALAWRKKVQTTTKIIKDPRVKKVITAKYGEATYDSIKRFNEDFIKNRMAMYDSTLKLVGEFRRRLFTSTLGLKLKQIPVQLSSMIGFMQAVQLDDDRGKINVSGVEFVEGAYEFLTDPKAYETLSKSEYMRARGSEFERDVASAKREGFSIIDMLAQRLPKPIGEKLPSKEQIIDATMAPTVIGDRGAIYIGGWSLYKKVLKETGSAEQAMEAFERVADSTQQSSDIDQLDSWQRGNELMKTFTGFLTTPKQYLRKEVHAFVAYAKSDKTAADKKRFLTDMFIFHFALPMAYQFVAKAGDVDGEDWARVALLGNLNAIPVMGETIEWALTSATNMIFDKKERVFKPSTLVIQKAFDFTKPIPALIKANMTGEEEDYQRVFKYLLEPVSLTTGFPVSNAERAIEHSIRGLTGEEDIDTAALGALGWPEGVLKNRSMTRDVFGQSIGFDPSLFNWVMDGMQGPEPQEQTSSLELVFPEEGEDEQPEEEAELTQDEIIKIAFPDDTIEAEAENDLTDDR